MTNTTLPVKNQQSSRLIKVQLRPTTKKPTNTLTRNLHHPSGSRKLKLTHSRRRLSCTQARQRHQTQSLFCQLEPR